MGEAGTVASHFDSQMKLLRHVDRDAFVSAPGAVSPGRIGELMPLRYQAISLCRGCA
jgi:hypothetical protein